MKRMRLVLLLLLVMFTHGCHPAPQRVDGTSRRRETVATSNAPAPAWSAETAESTRFGLGRGPSQNTAPSSADSIVEERATAPALKPLVAPAHLVALEVPGFLDAIVAVPLGTTSPRPVVLALHGNFDRPEWQCDVMREITEAYPFVLCPRGIRRRDVPASMDRWEYGSVKALQKEIDSGLTALHARFQRYVAEGPIVFTGFSLGAILGRPIVTGAAARYPRVLFTEGGAQGWDWARFKAGGGERVLFACAQAGCAPGARSVAKQAARYGVDVHVADGGKVGHTYDGPVARAIQAEWAWLVEGDERWRVQR
ncbi:MAG TPA: hypothetical protein VIV60_05195 [Polyangiaceae bacterium]